jgi:hypothetical protein
LNLKKLKKMVINTLIKNTKKYIIFYHFSKIFNIKLYNNFQKNIFIINHIQNIKRKNTIFSN